jgi:hypothetical protein
MSDSWTRDTGILLTALLIGLFVFKGHMVFLYAAFACALLLLFWYKAFYPVAYAWLTVSKVLAAIVPKVFFGLVFYLVVTPVGVVRRFFAHDSLFIVRWKTLESGFIERNHTFTAADGQNPY